MENFIGRKKELASLRDLGSLRRACLVVMRGRRRIGKSRLVSEFAKDKLFWQFSGLAPIGKITAQDQRDSFGRQFGQNLKFPPLTFTDWDDAFANLSLHITDQPTVILFDEISWMGAKDPTFIPKLKNWWDLALQQHPKLILILCGSVSTWITKNIINSTAFFGRITLSIDLPELTLPESYQLLRASGYSGSIYDATKILSITGGVPWYIEQIMPHQTADENIKRLCFTKNGLLVEEFNKIFHDIFRKQSEIYKKIVTILADGMSHLSRIRETLNYSRSGTISNHLKNLIIAGFVTEHYGWSMKSGKINKQKLYRLSDNYLRFFVKYIEPNIPKIENNSFQNLSLSNLVGWETMMGFQVESLLLKNRGLLQVAIGLNPADIVADNPYIQHTTVRQKGCQIDYLIQTHTHNLFIFEFKFNKREISLDIIEQMHNKVSRLSIPRGFGTCPILVHIGEIANSIYTKNYFYRIINIAELLNPPE